MANTINDQSSITNGVASGGDSFRETTGVQAWCYNQAYKGEVLVTRMNIDTVAAIVVDDPHINLDNTGFTETANKKRIYVVGINFSCTSAFKMTVKDGVDAGTTITKAAFDFAAKGGLAKEISITNPIWVTRPGAKLIFDVSTVSGTENMEVYYVIASGLAQGT